MFKIFSKIARAINHAKNGVVSAIVLCAGASTRFSDNSQSKQLAVVDGVSVIERTLNVFENCKSISEIVLVVRKEDSEHYKRLVCEKDYNKVKCIVIGGETRQISALKGFKHISDKSKYVVIHDGARCLVTNEIIETVLQEAIKHGIATAGTKNTDTVKLANEDGFIAKTLNRDYVWNVQTPQVFEYKKYLISAYKARQENYTATDDCMLAEYAGFKVKLVDTGFENIKITVKEDIKKAEAILFQRGEKK